MKIRFFSFLSLFQHGIRAKEENLILSCFSVSSTPGNLPVTVFLSGHRVSFRSPFPSPNTFRSVGTSLETTHRRRNFPANFPANFSGDLFFRHRPYQKERLEEISNFCEGTSTKRAATRRPRAIFRPAVESHAPARGARESFSGDAPPLPASPDADQPSHLPGSPIRALHVPLLGIFVSVGPPNSLSGEAPTTFSPLQSLHVPWEVFFYLSGGTTPRSEAVSLFRWCHAAI